jgi:hypothetical protein
MRSLLTLQPVSPPGSTSTPLPLIPRPVIRICCGSTAPPLSLSNPQFVFRFRTGAATSFSRISEIRHKERFAGNIGRFIAGKQLTRTTDCIDP